MDHVVGATPEWVHLLSQWGCHWQSFYVLLVEANRSSKHQPNQNSQTISTMTKRGKKILESLIAPKKLVFQFGLRYHHKSLLHALCANFCQHTKPSKQSSLSVLFSLFYFILLFYYFNWQVTYAHSGSWIKTAPFIHSCGKMKGHLSQNSMV